ncbi:MAG: J domain-containing protein, partial [Bradyrhizobiaceae bacterium]|nr:J domain-containing protein [Bradyrhizobiaceae bacterium]
MRDPYAVLGVPRSATSEEIKTVYRRLAKALHPDGNKDDPKAAAAFAELNAAHEILGDEDKRKAFDRGEIDARGRRVRRSANPRPIVAGFVIILLMLAATRILTTSREMHVNNNVKDIVLPRMAGDDMHAAAAPPRPPDRDAPHLILQQSATHAATNSIPLGIQIGGETFGLAVEISGLPTGMTLSAGRELGAGRWRIRATDVSSAIIQPPPGFGETVDLAIELRLADDTLVDHKSLRLRWLRVRTVVPDEIESVGGIAVAANATDKATTTPAQKVQTVDRHAVQSQLASEQVELLIARSQELIAQGDVGAARTLLRRAAEARDARATLALGATYDPVMLAIIRAQGVTADPTLARDWY